MFLIITLGGLSLFLALILTPVIRDRLGPLGFLDHPDGVRKNHSVPLPRVGGLSIALSYCLTFAIALVLPFSYTQLLYDSFSSIWRLAIPAAVVFLTGLLDDRFGLSAPKKLIGILIGCLLALWAGLRVDIHLLSTSTHPVISAVITVVWLVGCTNAFNLIDGMDGLAAGVGLLATAAMMLAGLTQGSLSLVLATLPLAGCLLGFLFYNFNPASVFLGDSGSLLIGFLLGCYGALWSEKSVTVVAMIAPLLALSVPMLDVGLSIARRFLRNRPIFEADRGHIHHKLLDRGLSPRGVVLSIYGFCALAATFSLLVGAMHNQFAGLIVILFCGFAWFGIRQLGYAEFKTVGAMFLRGGFRRIIDTEARLVELEQALLGAADMNECWTRILDGSRAFGFHGVHMRIDGAVFEASNGSRRSWQLRIPLASGQFINFSRDFGSELDPVVLSGFVDCVERGLKQKIYTPQPGVIRMPVAGQAYSHPPASVNAATNGA